MVALVAALALTAFLAACVSAAPMHTPGVDALDPKPGNSPAAMPSAGKADKPGWFTVEEAMGADCRSWTITDPPLGDTACYGPLPEHLTSFLRRMPDGHPFLAASEREEAARTKQRIKAVSGLGRRPDFVAVIEHFSPFWIRSFEGPDPDTTVYLVYGPSCIEHPNALRGVECLPGAPYTMRELRAYRVRNGEAPQELTRELVPPAPRLTQAERRRYGVYLQAQGYAEDVDVGLDVSRLVYAPVLRWILHPVQEGDYAPPAMPTSDPRAFEDFDRGRTHVAHFGFLVWTGKRFELREAVPRSFWPCRTVRHGEHACSVDYDSSADRYLLDAESADSGRATP